MDIVTERAKDYGSGDENLTRIAGLWSAYLGTPITAHDVCWLMVLVKASRARQDGGAKDDPGGFATWRGVLAGDAKAWKVMETYNRQDCLITESLLNYLSSWLRLPHAGLFSGDMRGCHACGARTLTPDGIVRTKVSAYLRLLCDCGAHNRLMADGTTRRA